MMKKLVILTMAVLVIGTAAQAAVATLTFNPVVDTYVDAGNPNTSYGGLDALRIQEEGTDWMVIPQQEYDVQRIFIQFDLPEILEGKTLTRAEFGIWLNDYSETQIPQMQLWNLNNYDVWDNTLTWNQSLNLLGNETVLDIAQSTDSLGRYYVWNLLDVWDYAADVNAGKVTFLLTVESEDNYSFAAFNSSRHEENPPYLTVAYIPEPATITLLVIGMGSIGVFRKKL